jgi:glycosyltransferase involved in cell wall biosynthesis
MAAKVVAEVALTYLPDVGGGETQLRDVISAVSKHYDTVVITMKPYQKGRGKPPCVERNDNVTVIRLPRPLRSMVFRDGGWKPLRGSVYLPLFIPYVLLWSLMNRKKVVAFHLHGLLLAPLCLALKALGMKCTISVHYTYTARSKMLNAVLRTCLSGADCVLALSELERGDLIKAGIPKAKVRKFTYWVDLNFLRVFNVMERKLAREKLGLEQSRFVVLFVGRLVREKGIDVVISLAKMMAEAEFYVVGDGPLRERVKEASSEIKNLHYVGPVENLSLAVWYNASNVFVMPTLNEEEGFGRVIIEALACGTPVIGSRRGGIPEAIDPRVGKVVEPTPQEFARAIREVAASNYPKSELREYAEKKFGPQNADVILQCIRQPDCPRRPRSAA